MTATAARTTTNRRDSALRWGLLSTARINGSLVGGARGTGMVDVVAVASRDRARAEAFARELGAERAHASYEALLADPEVGGDGVDVGFTGMLRFPGACSASSTAASPIRTATTSRRWGRAGRSSCPTPGTGARRSSSCGATGRRPSGSSASARIPTRASSRTSRGRSAGRRRRCSDALGQARAIEALYAAAAADTPDT